MTETIPSTDILGVTISALTMPRAVERVCGPDLLPELTAGSGETGHRHYF